MNHFVLPFSYLKLVLPKSHQFVIVLVALFLIHYFHLVSLHISFTSANEPKDGQNTRLMRYI